METDGRMPRATADDGDTIALDTAEPPGDDTSPELGPCDDDRDILVLAEDADTLAIWVSGDDFTFPERYRVDVPPLQAWSLVVAELDGDPALEIALRSVDEGVIILDAECGYSGAWTSTVLGRHITPMGASDFDEDGVLDLYGVEDDHQSVTTLLNRASSGFEFIERAAETDGVDQGYVLNAPYRPTDLDGDGHVDLVLMSYATMIDEDTLVYLARGRGDGTFTMPSYRTTVPTPVNTLDIGDPDQDGVLDVLAGMDDDGDAGRLFQLDPDLSGAQPWVDLTGAAESGTDKAGCAWGHVTDWDKDGHDELTLAYQIDPHAVTQVIKVVSSTGTATPAVLDLSMDLGTFPALGLGTPLRP